MLQDELKIPSDLDDDDEEDGEEEGLFPDDEGDFPIDEEYEAEQRAKKEKKQGLLDSDDDGDKVFEKVFKEANENEEMDIVGALVGQKEDEFIN